MLFCDLAGSTDLAAGSTPKIDAPKLRAARDLARVWVEASRRREAHELLAPVYGWFTEGFDTPDLVEAKALLAELS